MQKALRIVSLFLVINSLFLAVSALKFNEIMYDVLGSDDDMEWIEVVNEKNLSENIQDWKFNEAGTNHNVVMIQGSYLLNPGEFAVIAENPQVFLSIYPNYSSTLFDSTFSLSNTGETIVLKNKTLDVQDNLTYSFLWGGDENGYTTGLYNGVWKETFPTPGKRNNVSDECDWKVSILYNKLIYENSNEFAWKVRTERVIGEPSIPVTIKRSIEDIYGHAIRSYDDLVHDISTRETLSYDPNLKPGSYLIKTEIIPACNDSNPENNLDEQILAVKDSLDSESSVKIGNLYDLGKDNEAEFGQLIRVKVVAYKGDTTKNVVSLWIEGKEKISKVFKFDITTKFTSQDMTVPIQIFPNCDGKLKNGTYKIVVDGFGQKDAKTFDIYGNSDDSCPKIKEESKKESTNKEVTTSTTPAPKQVFNQPKPFAISTIMFESSQKKAEKLVPYALVGIMSSSLIFFVILSRGIKP